MNVLGLVTKSHDTGAAILRDGAIAAIMEEERFNRSKHTQLFPGDALAAALAQAGMSIGDIDVVTTPWNVSKLRHCFRKTVFANLPASLNLLRPAAHSTQNSGIVFLRQRLKRELKRRLGGKAAPPIIDVCHHDAHSAVFFVSPFDEAAVLVMDGYGDESATSAYLGAGNTLNKQWQLGFLDSLGALYTCVTVHLGFKPFEEGTTMALAACGGPTYVDKFRKMIHLGERGSFRFNPEYISVHTHGLLRPFTNKFIEEFGPPRAKDEPLRDHHRDMAAALQKVTEEAVLHIVRDVAQRTPSTNLVISGGVALNCVANAQIIEQTKFKRVWVPPCASDTGVPLGSALFHYHQTLGHPRVGELAHAYHGAEFSETEAIAAIKAADLPYEKLDDETLYQRVARDLAAKKIVGWFQGRAEIGPRALGNRSILADPRDVDIKTLLNARIKHREPFRPFAPAVLAERATEYFEVSQSDPFMTLAPRVKADKVAVIPAAVHVDGTGRIQTVDKRYNPRFHALISKFAEETGVPVVLNTSFNRQEPVVNDPADAVSCYLRTSMDVLVLGNLYVTARNEAASARAEAALQEGHAEMNARTAVWRQILES